MSAYVTVSEDEGRTDRTRTLTHSIPNWEFGYPSTVQTADGTLLTVWYAIRSAASTSPACATGRRPLNEQGEPMNNRVLAIAAHPDDIEVLCAGTLIRLHKLGYEIHIATMTPGDKGSATHTRQEIAAIRREEARAAANVIGAASYRCLEFSDLEIVFDNRSRRRVCGLIREVAPFLVITLPPADYMFDHEITSHLVRDACFNAAVPLYGTEGGAPLPTAPYLYYMDGVYGRTILGVDSPFSCIVDISEHIERKIEALCCHVSQRAWVSDKHGIDNFTKYMTDWGAHRGEQAGFAYGEGFCQHMLQPHPQDDKLSELLGARVFGRAEAGNPEVLS